MADAKRIEIKEDLKLTVGDITDACRTMMNCAVDESEESTFENSYKLDVFYPGARLIAIEVKVLNPVPLLKVVE